MSVDTHSESMVDITSDMDESPSRPSCLSPKSAEIAFLKKIVEEAKGREKVLAEKIKKKDEQKKIIKSQLLKKTAECEKMREVLISERRDMDDDDSDSDMDDEPIGAMNRASVITGQNNKDMEAEDNFDIFSKADDIMAQFVASGAYSDDQVNRKGTDFDVFGRNRSDSAPIDSAPIPIKSKIRSRSISIKQTLSNFFHREDTKTEPEFTILKEGEVDLITKNGDLRETRNLRFIQNPTNKKSALEIWVDDHLENTIHLVDVLTMNRTMIPKDFKLSPDEQVLTIVTSLGKKWFFSASADVLAEWKMSLTSLIKCD